MSTIFTLFMILIMIACVLLVIIVLAQNPKGGGLSGTFGGGAAQFGVQRTNDFMEKATWTLGGSIIVLILLCVILTGKPSQAAPAPAKDAAKKEAPATTPAPASNAAKPVQTPAPANK